MKMLDALKYFLFYSVNWFWVATFWAVVWVLGAAVVLGNGLPHWDISLWWVPIMAVIGLGPITSLILWMMLVMTAE